MHTLVIVANPDRSSLTHRAVEHLKAALPADSVEVADLHQEGFSPVFTLKDRLAYQTADNYPSDVHAEHARLDRATDVVFVFPVFWWSMPALLKGWMDRVLVNGWAFDWKPGSGTRPMLQRIRAHALPIAATSAGVWDRHGYETALRSQLEHGIVDYCGIQRGVVSFAYQSEDPESASAGAERAVSQIAEAILASNSVDDEPN